MIVEDEKLFINARIKKSVTFVQDKGNSMEINRLRNMRPDKPCHKIRESLLSSATGSIDPTVYINLLILLLLVTVGHIALESFLKHGILFNPVQVFKVFLYNPTESPSSLILIGVHVLPLLSLGIEVLLSKGYLNEKVGLTIITTLLTSELLIPAIIFFHSDSHIFPVFLVEFCVVCVFLKLVSYHVTNFWCREIYVHTPKIHQNCVSSDMGRRKDIGNGNVKNGQPLVHYPDNLNFKDLCYFVFAPTLCYELNFPRSARVRKMFLFKRVLEVIFLFPLIVCLIQQCFVPTLNDSLKFFQDMDYSEIFEIPLLIFENDYSRIIGILLNSVVYDCLRFLEILLKLAVPFAFAFVITAYFFYHSYLNAIAELLRFGDRYFYNEFWNSESALEFWENWNIPAHKWCIRHLYLPLRHRGFTNFQTSSAIFFISALFHEYFCILPLKIFSFWGFLFMIIQVPYSMITTKYLPIRYGHLVGCFFLAMVAPFCNIMYYHDYYKTEYQNV